MVDFYVMRIAQKKNSLNKVPSFWKKEVEKKLIEKGIDFND